MEWTPKKECTDDRKVSWEEVSFENVDALVRELGGVAKRTAREDVLDACTRLRKEKAVVEHTSIIVVNDKEACVSNGGFEAFAMD